MDAHGGVDRHRHTSIGVGAGGGVGVSVASVGLKKRVEQVPLPSFLPSF